MITREYLMEALDYDANSGVFTWRRSMRGPMVAGSTAGRRKPNGYIEIKISQRAYYAHRLAVFYMTGSWPIAEVDHVNRQRDDNRWCNLRCATSSQNRGNTARSRRNLSGLKGVSLHRKSGLWRARLGAKTLGYFRSKEAAHDAYLRGASMVFGEFASAG